MAAPLKQRGSVSLAQHEAVGITDQTVKLQSLAGGQRTVGVFIQQLAEQRCFCLSASTTSDAPERVIIKPVEGCQISLKLSR